MRSMHTADGVIGIYSDFLGAPCIKVDSSYLPLVAIDNKNASRIRLKEGWALSLVGMFNFKRVLAKIERDFNDIVFRRFNGQEMFRLKIAGTKE